MAKKKSSGGLIDISFGFFSGDDGVPPVYQSVGCNDDLKVKGREYGDGHGEFPEASHDMLNEGYETLDTRRPREKERRGLTPPVRTRKF